MNPVKGQALPDGPAVITRIVRHIGYLWGYGRCTWNIVGTAGRDTQKTKRVLPDLTDCHKSHLEISVVRTRASTVALSCKKRFCRHSLFMLIKHFLNLRRLRNLRKQMTQLTVLDTILSIITHLSQHVGCANRFSFSLQTL
jgi:hypothetical protein